MEPNTVIAIAQAIHAAWIEGGVILGGILLAEGLRRIASRGRRITGVEMELQEAATACSQALKRYAHVASGATQRREVTAAAHRFTRLLEALLSTHRGPLPHRRKVRSEVKQLWKRMREAQRAVLAKEKPGKEITDLDATGILGALASKRAVRS